jgi:hypothetical protein
MAQLRPTIDALQRSGVKLNDGERRVADALARLGDEWTVYVQPRFAMDVPDFVAVHPRHGVCAIEVKDWSSGAYRMGPTGRIEHANGNGSWKSTAETPRYQALRYRKLIHDQFFARPADSRSPGTTVRAIVVLPQYSTERARCLLQSPQVTPEELSVLVFGGQTVEHELEAAVRGTGCPPPPEQSLARLHRHLTIPEAEFTLRAPLPLSAGARDVERNPRNAKMRRVRGPAGCGKSLGLAARAARLALDGQSVLVVCFNITLAHYLRTLVNARCAELGADPTNVTCSSFHGFCRRVEDDAQLQGYDTSVPASTPPQDRVIHAARAAFNAGFELRYDAVLVDEGQDFNVDWWNVLRRHVVHPDGELLLVADPTQDVYDRRTWTEEAMLGAGFSGPWTELRGSYRLPPGLVPIVNRFSVEFLAGERIETTLPEDRNTICGAAGPLHATWRNVAAASLGREIGRAVIELLDAEPDLSPRDVVFLCETHRTGIEATRTIEAAGHDVHHIFDLNRTRQGIRKRRFWPEAPGVKGCTPQSFKGWEARAVVMGVGKDRWSLRLAYVALTRIKADSAGRTSYLRVVNSNGACASFGSALDQLPGTTWAAPVAARRVGA